LALHLAGAPIDLIARSEAHHPGPYLFHGARHVTAKNSWKIGSNWKAVTELNVDLID
jgi:hypothetical protein